VYSDEDVIVAFKPSGLHTVNVGGRHQNTLANWFSHHHADVMNVQGRSKGDGGILHRLDGATAGLVLAARSQLALAQLSSDPPFLKHYFALSTFDPEAETAPEVPIWPISVDSTPMHWQQRLRDLKVGSWSESGYEFDIVSQFSPFGPRGGRVKVVEAVQGQLRSPSHSEELMKLGYHSHCKLVSKLDHQTLAFKVSLRRGFRHQVRVHLSYIGCPVLGDPLYPIPAGNPSLPPPDALLQDIGLYATGIEFTQPTTRKRVLVSMPQFDTIAL